MRTALLGLLIGLVACCTGRQFDPSTRTFLSHSKLHVIYPSFIPKGFKNGSFQASDHSPATDSYEVTYVNSKGGFFTVQMASGHIPDLHFQGKAKGASPTSNQSFHTSLLGDLNIDRYDNGKVHQFHMNWKEIMVKNRPQFVSVVGAGIDQATAIKIVQGLRYFEPNPKARGR